MVSSFLALMSRMSWHLQGSQRGLDAVMRACWAAAPSPAPSPARGTPAGTPLLRSDPSAVPLAGEGSKAASGFRDSTSWWARSFRPRPPLATRIFASSSALMRCFHPSQAAGDAGDDVVFGVAAVPSRAPDGSRTHGRARSGTHRAPGARSHGRDRGAGEPRSRCRARVAVRRATAGRRGTA